MYWLKIGRWIELCNEFYHYAQITYNGENKKDKKVGKWEICLRQKDRDEFEKIGGGYYDDLVNGCSVKIGNWIELSENFGEESGQSKITFNGEQRNGQKIGKWIQIDLYWNQNCGEYTMRIELYYKQTHAKYEQFINIDFYIFSFQCQYSWYLLTQMPIFTLKIVRNLFVLYFRGFLINQMNYLQICNQFKEYQREIVQRNQLSNIQDRNFLNINLKLNYQFEHFIHLMSINYVKITNCIMLPKEFQFKPK
ncbi:unnamed protein product [Paramecium octaurelia]|uniref:Uncharacterized protein n=1 Tax=Paramecium octaurelia TaxID=43137 RepID=A0A8S1YQ34_PAROT|nr:unnamed protein product [Paramecium octaurelia]